MKSKILAPFALTLLWLPEPIIGEESKRSNVLQTAERIKKLERTQGDVGRQLGAASRKIDGLLKDLASNLLIEEGKGQDIDKMNKAVLTVKANRVPKASDELEAARTQIENAYPHLDEAGKEISSIIKDLSDLLAASEAALLADDLLRKIKALIKRESFLSRETIKWGKILVFTPAVAEADKPRVVRAQEEVVQELGLFKTLLKDAVGKASDEGLVKRFQKATKVFDEGKPDVTLRRAVTFIEQCLPETAVEAVQQQKKAIEILKEIERVLSSDDDDISKRKKFLRS